MSELPQGWTTCKVEDVFDSFSGGTPSKSTPTYWNGDIPWISSGEFVSDVINAGTEYITKEGLQNSSAKLCRPGSVMVVVRSGILKHSLPVAIVGQPLAINQDIKCFDAGRDDINRWLFLGLKAFAKEILSLNREGTTVQSVKYDTLKELELPIPPLNEQRRIVAKLETLLSRVDAAQARLATIPRILKRFRQSVLSAACSGRLTDDWRKQNPNIESAEIYLRKNVPDAVLLDNSEIPASWVCCNLGNLSELITKGASPKWQGINYSTRGVLFVTSENVGSGRMLLDVKKYVEPKFNELQKRSILKSGDLLTNIVGASIGRSAIYESKELANINQAVAVIRLGKFVDRRYVLSVLNSPTLIERMHKEKVDVARANLSLKDVGDFPVPVSPPEEQQEIVRRVEALFKTAGVLEARYREAKAHVDKLTQSILARAFRGELVNQDPNDEPASLLIERLRQSAIHSDRNRSVEGRILGGKSKGSSLQKK